ncbi:TOBE domain-containing protein, partial [Microcoleus sp. HI-ES]|nr:TOBE domain-containing protein [Microcoleus sp. HI-ES]
LQAREGQGFDLGIRPENIEIFTPQTVEDDDLKSDVWALEKVPLDVEVKVVEPLGRETLIRASLPLLSAETIVQLQIPASVRLRSGDRLTVQLDFDRLFIFDPSTGEALYP